MVLNSSFFAESKVRAPTVSNCFPLHFQKNMGLRGFFFWQKNGGLTILAWWRRAAPDCFRLFPTVSDCFRLFPTVSVSLERQLDLWTTDSTKITTFNSFPDDPSARMLLEMMHFDFETQYTLKIPKPQDLVKFNNTCMHIHIYIYNGLYWYWKWLSILEVAKDLPIAGVAAWHHEMFPAVWTLQQSDRTWAPERSRTGKCHSPWGYSRSPLND